MQFYRKIQALLSSNADRLYNSVRIFATQQTYHFTVEKMHCKD